MSQDHVPAPPKVVQRIVPYLTYNDAPAAIDFLCEAFGFEEIYRFPMEDGRLGHAEVKYEDNVLMLASTFPGMGIASPMDLDAVPQMVHVWVDDVDAHHERAKAAGATIAMPPADQFHGSRMYRALDLEGHRWVFAKVVKHMTPEEMMDAMHEAPEGSS